VLAEGDELTSLDPGRRGGGDEDLTAVGSGGDARRDMHVVAHVAVLGQKRGAGVDADPHVDAPGGECRRQRERGLQRSLRGREGEEERVSLRVHLDAALCGACLADQPPVLRKRLCVRLGTEVVQEPCRSLDVGEEEGDRAGRKLRAHARQS
jgi:hypothetical protein